MKTNNATKSSGTLHKPLALALTLGAGLGASSALGQTIEVGGAGVIGETVLTISSGVATVPATGANWTADGGSSGGGGGGIYSGLVSATASVVATGDVTLTFDHTYDFEVGWDGGAVFYSVNGGAFTYLDGSAFTANGYDGDTSAATNGFGDSSAWGATTNVFYNNGPKTVQSVATIAGLTAGDDLAVEFRGGWDEGTLNGPPAWEISTVKLTDAGANDILDIDFDVDGPSDFTVSNIGTLDGPWEYNATNISRFELAAGTVTADRYAPDISGSVIDLNQANIEVALLSGTLASSTTYSLFDLSGGTTLTGSIGNIVSLPPAAVWDTSNLEVDGTITVTAALNPADGLWTLDGDGDWADIANWDSGTIAYGTDQTADFTVATSSDRTVTLNTDITIGNIIKDDTSGNNDRLIFASGNTLTLDVTSGSPVITNSDPGSGERFEIACQIAGSDGLTKDGPGYVLLNNNSSSWTGPTTVNDGLLYLASIDLANIGAGSGRDISVAAGAIVQRQRADLNNAFLNRLVETTDEFGVFSSSWGQTNITSDLDFSSSTGANLPNAFFGTYATNGAQCRYDGVLTPASDNYRLGFPGASGALHMMQPLVDIGTPRGLIVGGGAVNLVAENTFTGDTVLRDGRLFLGRQLALQNSALNVGNGVDGNTGILTFNDGAGGGAPTPQDVVDEPTLGGLIGSRNLASIYSSANQNNTSRLAIENIVGITLDVDTGKTHTYSGNARLSTGMYLTKTGLGTQLFDGDNDYTGTTSVDEGTLALAGGSHASPITVATGAFLDFNLGFSATSTASVDLTDGEVSITGVVDNASDYLLMTAAGGFTFTDPTTQLNPTITDYELELQNSDTELWLVYTGVGGVTYASWSGSLPADGDANADGVENAVAYALGAANVSEDATGLLPTSTEDATYLIFSYNRSDDANDDGTTAIEVEYGSDLSGWTVAQDGVAGVIITETLGSPTDAMEVKIPKTLAVGDKLFARLRVVVTP